MITVSGSYKDIKKFEGFDILREHGLGLLKETTETFFNCKVSFLFEPVRQAKKHFEINLHENPKRGCYPINDDCFFIYARVLDENVLTSGLGLILRGTGISLHKNFMNHFEGALTSNLSKSYKKWFEDCSLIFGDELLLHSICNFSSRGVIDYRRFYHIANLFLKLRTTTFENEPFSTGLIVTKSHHAYRGKNGEDRGGSTHSLSGKRSLKSTFKIDKRFWYLADGKQCFLVGGKDLYISHLFVLGESYKELDYVDSNFLSLTLKGGDILFRTEGDGNLSIISSENIEFMFLENQWRIRDYQLISRYLGQVIKDSETINRLLFFVLYCSRSHASTVVWVPGDIKNIKEYVKPDTLNRFIDDRISIRDTKYTNHIFRCLASDGATIISANGELLHFGCIVDVSRLDIKGLKGTGESAAQILSENGIAIKVSEDGTIKLFLPNSTTPMLL